MSELAKLLKSKREEIGKTVKMVSQETKIRENSILLMDKGAFQEMPSYLHAYGFVKQYAEYLGYDYEMQIKPIFDIEYPKTGSKAYGVKSRDQGISDSNGDNGNNGNVKKEVRTDKVEFVEDTEEPVSNNNVIIISIVVGLLVVAAISYYVFYSFQNVSSTIVVVEREDEPENMSIEYPSPTTNINTLLDETTNGTKVSQATNNQLTSPVSNTAVKRVAPPVEDVVVAPTPKRLIFGFTEECWVKYQSDELPPVEYFGLPGQSKAVYFIDNFTLDIGNAAGLSVTYGRQTLDQFGKSGVVRRGLKYKLENDKLVQDIKR